MVGDCQTQGCGWRTKAGLQPTHRAISKALFDNIMEAHAGTSGRGRSVSGTGQQDAAKVELVQTLSLQQAVENIPARKCEVIGCEYNVPACPDFSAQNEALKLHWEVVYQKVEHFTQVKQKIYRPTFPQVATDVEVAVAGCKSEKILHSYKAG